MVSLVTILAVLGISNAASYFFIPASIALSVKYLVNLREGGFLYSDYITPPFSPRSQFHIFAVKNPR